MEEAKTNFSFQPPSENKDALASVPAPLSGIPAPEKGKDDKPAEEQKKEEDRDVIFINRKEYAVGLFWQPLQDPDDPIPEIRETMESDSDACLYTLYTEGRAPQYGVGRASHGHKEGQIAAASSVLSALSEKSSFVGVFEVKEGWWFVAARNDLVLPEEDVLYRTEEEAKDAFYSMMAVPDWGFKIAPDTWHIDGTQEMDLSELFKNATPSRLQGISASRSTKVLIAMALLLFAIVALIVAGVFLLIETEDKPSVDITPVSLQAEIVPVVPKLEEEKPWEKLVSAEPFLETCWNYSYQLKAMQIPGWGLQQIVCTHEGLKTGWNKTWGQGGRVAWFQKGMEEYGFKDVVIEVDDSATSATATVKFENLPLKPSHPTLSLKKLQRELTDISQAMNFPISMSPGEVTGQAQSNNPNQEPPRYRYLSFSFSSNMDPPAWEAFFDKFTALEIVKVEYNPNSDALSNNWSYEGRIYEKQ